MSITWKRKPVEFFYTLAGESLEKVNIQRDLGVWFDSKLTFHDHIDKTVSKAMQLLGMLYRLKELTNKQALLTYYKAIVLPTIDYCATIWGMSAQTHLDRVQSPLSFFIRILKGRVPSLKELSVDEISKKFNLQPFNIRNKLQDLTFVYKCVNGCYRPADLAALFAIQGGHAKLSMRKTDVLHVPYFRLNILQRSFLYRIPKLVNDDCNISDAMFSMNYAPYRKFVHLYLQDKPP